VALAVKPSRKCSVESPFANCRLVASAAIQRRGYRQFGASHTTGANNVAPAAGSAAVAFVAGRGPPLCSRVDSQGTAPRLEPRPQARGVVAAAGDERLTRW
jgi:hypothetical protein